MKVWEFENAVWNRDGIRIVIRASANDEVEDYPYKKAAQWNRNITWLLENHIRPFVGGYEVVVIGGNGEQPFGGNNVQTIRDSYRSTT